jgi:4-aminobutyrate aminotransferase
MPSPAGGHRELLERHKAVLPSWMALYYDEPIELVSGDGRRVRDAEGRSYLDFFAGILTNMLGYNVPEIREAIIEQLGSGIVHTSTLYLIRHQVELAERIAKRSPMKGAKVFFTNSGTEANEAALLLATTARRSNQILALRNSYHGRSFASMAVTGNRGWSASSLSPVNVSYLHSADRLRGPFAGTSDAELCSIAAADCREVIETTTAGDVACLIAEPIQGVGGFVTPPDGYFAAIAEVLEEYGILFVDDEVQTGWGRTGEHYWGIEAHGIVPDAMTFAKGLGNGMAIGGVVARPELMDAVNASSISTFGGNPLATAAASAVLDYVASHDLQANAALVAKRLFSGLHALAEQHRAILEVRGRGLMIGVELGVPGSLAPDAAAARAVMESAKTEGLLIGRGGLYGNVLRIAPPLTTTEAEADEALACLGAALSHALGADRFGEGGAR